MVYFTLFFSYRIVSLSLPEDALSDMGCLSVVEDDSECGGKLSSAHDQLWCQTSFREDTLDFCDFKEDG